MTIEVKDSVGRFVTITASQLGDTGKVSLTIEVKTPNRKRTVLTTAVVLARMDANILIAGFTETR